MILIVQQLLFRLICYISLLMYQEYPFLSLTHTIALFIIQILCVFNVQYNEEYIHRDICCSQVFSECIYHHFKCLNKFNAKSNIGLLLNFVMNPFIIPDKYLWFLNKDKSCVTKYQFKKDSFLQLINVLTVNLRMMFPGLFLLQQSHSQSHLQQVKIQNKQIITTFKEIYSETPAESNSILIFKMKRYSGYILF